MATCTYFKNFLIGTAVITLEKAALWTDGRTFQSAIDDVDCGWTVYRKGTVANVKKALQKWCLLHFSR